MNATPEDPPAEAEARPGRSVRWQLAAYTLALVGPVLLFVAFLLWQIADRERQRLENEASDFAAAIALAIDRELTGVMAAIDVLANSTNLQNGNLQAFREQAAVLMERLGVAVLVTDTDGQQLVNTRVPFGTPLPHTGARWAPEDVATGVYVTNLFQGPLSKEPTFAVVRSVAVGGERRYALVFGVPAARLGRIIGEVELPGFYTASVVDRDGVIMARSSRAEEFVGQEATADLRANTAGRQGTWSGTTVDGREVFGTFVRSRLSDFRAVVGIRSQDLNAPLWRSLSLFAALGSIVGGLSVVLSYLFGRRITNPIKALAARAAALGEGEPVAPLASGLGEADAVGLELAAASSRLRERETDLREANEELQRFAYIVSHDLRSPLVNIMGFTTELEALRQDMFGRLDALRAASGAADAKGDEALGRDFDEAIGFIKASIAKMDRLINAILNLSRAGRREFNPERVDMDALVSGIRASLQHQADEANATVTAGRLPAITSDRLALEQIFSNLVDNALKYLRTGVPGRVEVTGRAASGGLVFEVRDNGRGIEARDRERVFDLFRRSGVQDRPGEGIGLAHVRALVRRLGGSITLTSEPGRGSTFTVTLPRRWRGEKVRKAA